MNSYIKIKNRYVSTDFLNNKGVFAAHGYLEYDKETGWIYLKVSSSIAFYYRKVIERIYWTKLSPPLFGAHITVVAGKYEDLRRHKNWGAFSGQRIDFHYSNDFCVNNAGYWWLPIKEIDGLKKVRRSLGLDALPKFPYHLTVGYEQK